MQTVVSLPWHTGAVMSHNCLHWRSNYARLVVRKNASSTILGMYTDIEILTYARLLAGSMGHWWKLSTGSCAAPWWRFPARCNPSSSLPTPSLFLFQWTFILHASYKCQIVSMFNNYLLRCYVNHTLYSSNNCTILKTIWWKMDCWLKK